MVASSMVAPLCAFSETRAQVVDYLVAQPNDVLIAEARKLISADSLSERARDCLLLVVKRYYEDPTDKGLRRDATIALRNLGNLRMTHLIDYREAFHNLMLAKQIAEEDGNDYELAYVCLSLSNLYNFNAGDDDRFAQQSLSYQEEAYRLSLKTHNEDVMNTVVLNLALIAFKSQDFKPYISIWEDMLAHKFAQENDLVKISKMISKAALAYAKGDSKGSDSMLEKTGDLLKDVPPFPYKERYFYNVNNCRIRLLTHAGEYAKAVPIARGCLNRASVNNHLDYEIFYAGRLALLFESLNEQDSIDKYYNFYLTREAELRSEHGYEALEALVLQHKIETINRNADHKEKGHRLSLWLWAGVVLLIAIIVAFAVAWNHKRRQNSVVRKEPVSDESEANPAPPEGPELERLREVYGRIIELMDTSDEICQPGFSLAGMAKRLSVPSRIASQAINTCHNTNFHQLLNEYRVKRVMEMMRDPEAKNVTIQSLAEAAGFKSRTHFTATFKKITGETPSDFWNREHLN